MYSAIFDRQFFYGNDENNSKSSDKNVKITLFTKVY